LRQSRLRSGLEAGDWRIEAKIERSVGNKRYRGAGRMSQLVTHTRGLCNWRDRLASPDRQWKRKYSAFEAAVAWETASARPSGLPKPIEQVFQDNGICAPVLLLAVAEHKVDLPGGNAASQCDVWAIVKTVRGLLSLTVEAKAGEAFGDEILEKWLGAGKTDLSIKNRKVRWEHVRANLPIGDSFLHVRYQILHRCAAAIIEAKRWGCPNAAFIVQAFDKAELGKADTNFKAYEEFCAALKLPAVRAGLSTTAVDGISLSVGWVDCPMATDAEVAACA
jgi:hypothetical protein